MDLKSNHSPPVLTDPAPMNKSRSGIHSAVLPHSSTGAAFSIAPFLTIPRKKPGLRVDVRSISWLDAMQSSSPTHKKIIKGPNTKLPTDNDFSYRNWMLKYPSALTSFEKITNYAKGKRIALFLDYDGTLSPIVDDPDRVFMSDAMRAAVRNVAKYFPTAIISGRSRYKVYEFVGLTELYYAGSHRMDIMGPVWPFDKSHTNCIRSTYEPGKEVNFVQPASEFFPMIDEVYRFLVEITGEIKGAKVENNKLCVFVHYRNVDEKSWTTIAESVHKLFKHYPCLRLTHGRKVLEVRPVLNWYEGKEVNLFQRASGFLPMIDEVYRSLVEITEEIKGAKVENNKFCVSVHYSNVDEKSWTSIAQSVHKILKHYPCLRLTHGRKVSEVRPVLNWDKGKVVEFLLESLGLSNCDNVLPIYIGDDRTDEDAFKVLREGNRGYGILVSSMPKESNAFYSLRDPSEVMDFLKLLVTWKKSSAL